VGFSEHGSEPSDYRYGGVFFKHFCDCRLSGTSYHADGNAYLPTLITWSNTDDKTWTDGQTDGLIIAP